MLSPPTQTGSDTRSIFQCNSIGLNSDISFSLASYQTEVNEPCQLMGISDSQKKATVRKRRLPSGKLGPVDPEAGSASVKGWVSIPGSCMGISSARSWQTRSTECEESAKNLFLFRLRANPSPYLFGFLSSTLGCVCYILCVCKAIRNDPGRRWEKPLDDRRANELV